MHLIKMLLVFVLFISGLHTSAQKINILAGKEKISLRGLSVADDQVIWASGSNGTVARSTNGGKSFEWLTVKGFEQRDFRDIEAFDSNTAIIMAIAEPAVILKTTNAGKSWYKVFEDSTKGMFLDAMDFADNKGIVIGDPIGGKVFIAITYDKGETWKAEKHQAVDSGEAFFASSGTNIKIIKTRHVTALLFAYASGGMSSNFYYGERKRLPLIHGKQSTGANSLANYSDEQFIVVGGDFANDKDTTSNCVLTNNAGLTWLHPQTSPHGYRSCVEYITEKKLITCGTSGVDISQDGGLNWRLISTESFHVCQKAKKGHAVYLAGKDGRIAKLDY